MRAAIVLADDGKQTVQVSDTTEAEQRFTAGNQKIKVKI